MMGNVFVLVIAAVFIFDKMVMFIYCRLMSMIDKKRSTKTVKQEAEGIGTYNKIKSNHNQSKFRNFARFMIDHFMYGWMRYSIIITGKIPSYFFRNFLYRVVYNMQIAKKTVIAGGCEIRSPWNFKAGRCIIMNNCVLDARAGITIDDEVVLGQGVHIWTEEHDVDSPGFKVTESTRGNVSINKRAWICSDSTILPSIEIGEGAVLASRACATKDLESFGVYAGIPAKRIKERNKELDYMLPGRPHWSFY